MKNKILLFYAIVLACIMQACNQNDKAAEKAGLPIQKAEYEDQFKEYWYKGKAEITSYHLEQARYGEIHQGHAVTIFVTEDFSKSKQVKLDNPQDAGSDKVPIMKLNLVKKFTTGIYPYSLMESVFTPVDLQNFPHTLKTSMSSQEWCGHTFTQLNLRRNSYHLSVKSYFESEGDMEMELEKVLLEDELWNRIRINPLSLPTGRQMLIPASFFIRLLHKDPKPAAATISLETEGSEMIYTIEYENLSRRLTVRFQKDFPFQILSWEETTGTVSGNQPMVTKATLMKSMMTPYWNQHNIEHLPLREELMIPRL